MLMSELEKNKIQSKPVSLQSFKKLVDTIPNLCWIADKSGEAHWFNKRWYEYTGTTPGQMEDASRRKALYDPEEIVEVLEIWQLAIPAGKPFEFVSSIKGADGNFRAFLTKVEPDYDDNGELSGWFGTNTDISDLRSIEASLRSSEERFESYTEAMPQMAFISDEKGNITYFNKRWYEYTGKTKNTEGWPWKGDPIHHPDDLERTIETWERSLETGEQFEIEYRIRRHDGEYRWHLGRAVPTRRSDGTIYQWVGTNTDIHEQKRLAENQAFLLSAAKEIVSTTNNIEKSLKAVTRLAVPKVADWCAVDLLRSNNEFEQVALSYADSERLKVAKDLRLKKILHCDDSSIMANAVKTGKTCFHPYVDSKVLSKIAPDKQSLKQLEEVGIKSIIVAPISIKGSPVGSITFITADSGIHYSDNDRMMAEELASRVSLAMTNNALYLDTRAELRHRKQLEKELVKERGNLESRVARRTKQLDTLNTELVRSNQELQDFAYVASHDLQEPLRKIQAFGGILENEYGGNLGDGIDYLRRMHAAATRMSQLIEDLLLFSRVSTRPPTAVDVDLNLILEGVLGDLENQIERTNGQVIVEDLPYVKADPTHMRQLFQNLIGNALKFHKENTSPVVTLSSRPVPGPGNLHEIIVTDNGIGFDEKYAERIFGVFQRLHARNVYDGTGIGLAVCRKIVERYGGTISVESQPGIGSKFIIRIPG